MEKRFFRFAHTEARRRAAEFCMTAPDGWVAVFSEPNRTLDQNAAQWPILDAFAKQCEVPVFPAKLILPLIQAFHESMGATLKIESKRVSAEAWKDILTGEFSTERGVIACGPGGLATIGQRTSGFSKREFSEWLEWLHATAAQRNVVIYEDERAA